MRERKAVTRVLIERYRKARKKEKGRVLDELIELTGYCRCYGAHLLRRYGQRLRKGKITLLAQLPVKVRRRPRSKTYDAAVVEVLKPLWQIMDYPCGKRFVVMIAEVLPILERHEEISPAPAVRQKLLQISAATIDRLLAPERKRLQLHGRSGTKPGTLLKHQIPIRTFAEWDEQRPGFIEIDLVGHDGGNLCGDYAQTLNATDVATGWTEPQAIQNKAQVWTFEALKPSVSGCLSRCSVSIRTMAANSSTRTCCAIARKRESPLPAHAPIARMTAATSNRRTTRWYVEPSAMRATIRPSSYGCSTRCTANFGCTRTTSSR